MDACDGAACTYVQHAGLAQGLEQEAQHQSVDHQPSAAGTHQHPRLRNAPKQILKARMDLENLLLIR